jgi:di- and tripeptidase
MVHSDLYTCAEDGSVQRYSAAFERTASWSAHDGIVLSSVIASSVARKSEGERAVDSQSGQERQFDLITGGNDEHIKV